MADTNEEAKSAPAHLLVVDDNEMNRDMLSRRLLRRAFEVSVAEDGYRALAMIEQHSFDLILLDIMMPGLSGLQVLERLRASHSVAELPIIMVTAKGESKDVVEALALGANDYVTKPIDFKVALARIKTQLTLKRKTEEIRQLATRLELRNRFIRQIFGRYLSDEVVNSLLDSPQALEMGGERRRISIMMSDLRGFTSLSEQLEPERVVMILNRYFQTMVDIVLAHNGMIDEIIGDGMLIVFGAPIRRDDDAERSVCCALAMQRAMEQLNQQNRADGLPELEMGIGLTRGEAVVGNIGSDRRTKYGVVGRVVNLASRVESFSVGGQVLVVDGMFKEVSERFQVGNRVDVHPKGVDYPITIVELLGFDSRPELALPRVDDELVVLSTPLPVQYAFVEGKRLGDKTSAGRVVRMSKRRAEIESDGPVRLLSNVRLQFDQRPDGEGLYAKLIARGEGRRFLLHFTAVAPDLLEWIEACSSA